MAFLGLVLEETRAHLRGRFTLLGATILLTILAILGATAGTGNRITEFLVPAFIVAPLLFIPITAVAFSRPRSAHFLEGVFTSPISATTYAASKFVASLLLGVMMLASSLPLLLIESLRLGFRETSWLFVVAGVLCLAHSCALGLFLGVLLTGRSVVPTLTVSVVCMLLTVSAWALLRPVYSMDPSALRETLLAVLHVFGPVLINDFLGLGSLSAAEPVRAGLWFAVQTVGLLLGAWFVFTRAQSAARWEFGALRAGFIVTAVLSCTISTAMATQPYHELGEPTLEQGSNYTNMTARLTSQAVPPTPVVFSEPPVIAAEAQNQRFLWLFLPAPLGADLVGKVRVTLAGERLQVSPTVFDVPGPVSLPRAASRVSGSLEPYIVVPVKLVAPPPDTLRENAHALSIRVVVELEDGTFIGEGKMGILSAVPQVTMHVGAAAGIVPGLTLGAAIVRRWRMR